MKIPLAEHFHSIQGEGQWVGTPMHFIRLPGCTVGQRMDGIKPETPPGLTGYLPSGKLPWLCHRFDGQPFWCDTDFHKYLEMELDDLLAETWEQHICLTGGEPLAHPQVVEAIIDELASLDIRLHIETSGTIAYDYPDSVWVTCSPKQGWLHSAVLEADELKLLVDEHFGMDLPPAFLNHPNVYVSPINQVDANPISQANLMHAQAVLRAHPDWKLSVQLHKYLGLR